MVGHGSARLWRRRGNGHGDEARNLRAWLSGVQQLRRRLGGDCILSDSGDALLPFLTGFTGGAQSVVPVPNSPAFVDQTVFGTWLVFDPTAPNNPGGYVSTNAVAATMTL